MELNTTKLHEQFTRLKDEKNSLIILGLDAWRISDSKILELTDIKEGLIGFKPNLRFYQRHGGRQALGAISERIGPNFIRILDNKLSDGANTNEAEISAFKDEFEYMTLAPSAGCIEDTIDRTRKHGVETISMGVMSFPGVLREIELGNELFKSRIDRAIAAGTSAFVLGATAYVPESKFEQEVQKYRTLKSDRLILEDEMSNDELNVALIKRNKLFKYVVEKMNENPHLVALVPGFGRQGGNLEYFLESGVDLNRCMINAGSDILKADNPTMALKEMNAWINSYRLDN